LKGIGIMRKNLFWLSHKQWTQMAPHLPTDMRGVERADDHRVISGIVHVLKSGCRWQDCPPEYGPHTTIYNRFTRWARRGIRESLFRQLAGNGRSADTKMIDSTHVKAHRSASGGKGEQKQAVGRSRDRRNTKIHALADAKGRPIAMLLTGGEAHDCPLAERLIDRVEPAERLLGDKAYDSNELRDELSAEASQPFPTASIGSARSPSANASTSSAGASRVRSTG
jgi:transposase